MYGSVYDADIYFGTERLGSESWFDENEQEKIKSLNHATRLIESLNFVGCKTDPEQQLEFPRGGDSVVPRNIEHACYEIAFALLDGRDIEFDAESSEVQAAGFGKGIMRMNPEFVDEAKSHSIPSIVAWRLLKPYLARIDTVKISRVS